MSLPIFESADDVCAALRRAIESAIAGARVEVTATSDRHFEIQVTAKVFAGKSMVQQQRLVYGAIKELMQGDDAPVHAIDRMRTFAS